jgi:ferredoxin
MSKKDGKCTLIGSKEKRGFHSVIVGDDELEENLEAVKVCPVKIIKVEQI